MSSVLCSIKSSSSPNIFYLSVRVSKVWNFPENETSYVFLTGFMFIHQIHEPVKRVSLQLQCKDKIHLVTGITNRSQSLLNISRPQKRPQPRESMPRKMPPLVEQCLLLRRTLKSRNINMPNIINNIHANLKVQLFLH